APPTQLPGIGARLRPTAAQKSSTSSADRCQFGCVGSDGGGGGGGRRKEEKEEEYYLKRWNPYIRPHHVAIILIWPGDTAKVIVESDDSTAVTCQWQK